MIDVSVGAVALAGLYAGWAGLLFLRRGRDFTFPTVSWSTAILTFGLVMVVVFATSWRGEGRTPGDRVLGLRVVTTRGGRLGWIRAVVRAVLAVLFPLLLLWAAISREHRSVHDLLMGTKVIYDWQTSPLGPRSDNAVGPRVDVAPAVADEPDQGHPESLGSFDGER
jgi:uncharacterized RDD family membrane protein YckC